MDSWSYETQMRIKLHQQDLIEEAERDRLLAGVPGTLPMPLRRFLTYLGRRLVSLGTRLETRYADVAAPVSWTVARKGNV